MEYLGKKLAHLNEYFVDKKAAEEANYNCAAM